MGEERKIPGSVKVNIGSNIAPKDNNENLRHKLLHAFFHAYPGLKRSTVDMILDHPEKLGQNSFIEAVSTLSERVRKDVAECIIDCVQKSEELR